MDYMQELDSMMEENKVVLERLRGENFSSYSSEDMFYRAKTLMELGYPVYAIIEVNGKAKNVQLLNHQNWTAKEITVKYHNGEEDKVSMNSIKRIK